MDNFHVRSENDNFINHYINRSKKKIIKRKYKNFRSLFSSVFVCASNTWASSSSLKKKSDSYSRHMVSKDNKVVGFISILPGKKKSFPHSYYSKSAFWKSKILFFKKKYFYSKFRVLAQAFLKRFLIKSRFLFLNFFFKKKNIFLNISKSNGHLLLSRSLKNWLEDDDFRRVDIISKIRFFKSFFSYFKSSFNDYAKKKKLASFKKLRFILNFTGPTRKFLKFVKYLDLASKINIFCVRSRKGYAHNGCRSKKKRRRKLRNKNKFSKKITKLF